MPSITKMIRMDHTHVLSTFHKYQPDLPARVKKGLIDTICLSLEIHAQLEEEIFYPAMREVSDNEVLRKSEPEHYQLKQLCMQLRGMANHDPMLDRTFLELMQKVIHHVADEETVLLPEAERLLAGELTSMGMRMTRRRLELAGPRTPAMASGMARAMSGSTMLMMAVAMLAGGLLLAKRSEVASALKQAQSTLRRRRLMATVQNWMPGKKSLATRVLAR